MRIDLSKLFTCGMMLCLRLYDDVDNAFGDGDGLDDLHPVEVGMLLGLDISQIVAMVAQAMHDDGTLVLKSLDPLQAIPVGPYPNEIERRFAEIFDDTGEMDVGRLNAFLEWAVSEMQDKTWDCDLPATRAYYLGLLYDNPEEVDPTKLHYKFVEGQTIAQNSPAIAHAHYWRYCSDYYMGAGRRECDLDGVRESLGESIAEFSAVGEVRDSLEKACYSACHDACHDACYSAPAYVVRPEPVRCEPVRREPPVRRDIAERVRATSSQAKASSCHTRSHDACHSACHDACHSACVSGRAR